MRVMEEEEEEQEQCLGPCQAPFLLPFAITGKGSRPAAARRALPLGVLVRAGTGGCPILLGPALHHVWHHTALQPLLPLAFQHHPAHGELSLGGHPQIPLPPLTASMPRWNLGTQRHSVF